MPRYFVDYQDGKHFHRDEVGSDLVDLDAARKEAIGFLPGIARDELPDGEDRTFIATVRDTDGHLLYRATLTFHGERLASPELAHDHPRDADQS